MKTLGKFNRSTKRVNKWIIERKKFVLPVFIGLIGVATVLLTGAAPITINFEPENGSNASTAIVNDALASGGKFVQFNTSTSTSRDIDVNTSQALTDAIANAQPGDTIRLADGVYEGKLNVGNYTGSFSIVRSGTAASPITLIGSRNAVIEGGGTGGRYGLYIFKSNYWNITGITVRSASKGIVMDGSNHLKLDNIRVHNIGSEAVHFRAFSSDNVIQNSIVEETGVTQAQYGEGVYIGSANSNWGTHSGGQPDASNRNKVINNVIRNTGAESIDIKEGTIDGIVQGNQFDGFNMKGENSADSWIDVKGNNYTISNNTGIISSSEGTIFYNGFEIHVAVAGWGNNNVFHNNTLNLANATAPARSTHGFGFYQQKGVTGNILSCDNIIINATSGFGVYNVAPQPCNDS